MKITVNGESLEVKAADLAALLVELDYEAAPVATAINETFVRAKDRAGLTLNEGDRVEILTPRQGG
jgi:sulfur carrier protein